MRTGRIGLLMLLLALPLSLLACTETDDSQSAAAGLRTIGPADAVSELAAADGATLIDVRTPAEFNDGALRDAQLIDVQAPDFREQVDALDRDATYYLYCRSGNRSGVAAQIMADMGFTDLINIGGYEQLVAAGASTDR